MAPSIANATTTPDPATFPISNATTVLVAPHSVPLPPAPVAREAIRILDSDVTVESMVTQEFKDAPVMVRVARAESGFDPLVKNSGSTATGVFQILKGTWVDYGCGPLSGRTNAAANVACARKIYDDAGTAPWNASSSRWR